MEGVAGDRPGSSYRVIIAGHIAVAIIVHRIRIGLLPGRDIGLASEPAAIVIGPGKCDSGGLSLGIDVQTR